MQGRVSPYAGLVSLKPYFKGVDSSIMCISRAAGSTGIYSPVAIYYRNASSRAAISSCCLMYPETTENGCEEPSSRVTFNP